MIIEGMVSISFERNSMWGMSEKVWLKSGSEETMVIPDMTPNVATRSRDICMFFVILVSISYFLMYDNSINPNNEHHEIICGIFKRW